MPLPKVRKELLSRWRELFLPAPPPGLPPAPAPPVWHGIRLRRTLSLAAKEKFKIVVVLREPASNTSADRTKGVDGPTGQRRIRDERTVRRARWPLVTAGVGVLLAGALVAANLLPEAATAADPTVECVRGEVDVVGSSAFAPIMTTVANRYSHACDGATVRVTATGDLVAQPAAVVVSTLVANDSVDIAGLTVEQVRDIYAGRYRDWAQLRPGPSLPIRIVGRGQESGSRRTFERTVLGATSEGDLTSDSCEGRRPQPGRAGDPLRARHRG